jgi:hypothetical protein
MSFEPCVFMTPCRLGWGAFARGTCVGFPNFDPKSFCCPSFGTLLLDCHSDSRARPDIPVVCRCNLERHGLQQQDFQGGESIGHCLLGCPYHGSRSRLWLEFQRTLPGKIRVESGAGTKKCRNYWACCLWIHLRVNFFTSATCISSPGQSGVRYGAEFKCQG